MANASPKVCPFRSPVKGSCTSPSRLWIGELIKCAALGSRKRLHLEPGDRVLLDMRRDEGKLDLRIPLYADVISDVPANLRSDSADGRIQLTLPKNSLTNKGASNDLQIVATLEKKSQGREEELRVERPWFVWFEVTPRNAADGDRPRSIRIDNLKERIAPAWEINVESWVAAAGKNDSYSHPAAPAVNAWWVDVFPGDAHRITITKLESLDQEFGKIDKNVTIDRSKASIDDIRIDGNYLYVRATHEQDNPIVVRVQGLKKDEQRLRLGEMHHWYTKANKYMARFGPIDPADMTRQVTFQFYTLESLKKEKASSHARLDPDKPEPSTRVRDKLPRIKEED